MTTSRKKGYLKCYGEECYKNDLRYKKEKIQKLNSKNYCPKCYEVEMMHFKERTELYQYVCKLYNLENIEQMMLLKKQISDFHTKSKFRYKGIEITIQYMLDNENVKFDKRGLALVPYYYDRAKEWYAKKLMQEKEAESFEVKEIVVTGKITRRDSYKESKLLNMEELL